MCATSVRSLIEALDLEVVYSSNAIEGNSLTLRETQLVLEQGITIGGKPLKDHLEAVHLSSAWQRVKELAETPSCISEKELLELHRLLGGDDPHAGSYRNVPVFIRGAKHIPPNARKIPVLMERLLSPSLSDAHPVVACARLHYSLVSVHPFVDGNGRTARLLMNLHLLRGGYPPLRILPSDRSSYDEALDASTPDDSAPFERWITERELGELQYWLSALSD